jgi:hypothetical protein
MSCLVSAAHFDNEEAFVTVAGVMLREGETRCDEERATLVHNHHPLPAAL